MIQRKARSTLRNTNAQQARPRFIRKKPVENQQPGIFNCKPKRAASAGYIARPISKIPTSQPGNFQPAPQPKPGADKTHRLSYQPRPLDQNENAEASFDNRMLKPKNVQNHEDSICMPYELQETGKTAFTSTQKTKQNGNENSFSTLSSVNRTKSRHKRKASLVKQGSFSKNIIYHRPSASTSNLNVSNAEKEICESLAALSNSRDFDLSCMSMRSKENSQFVPTPLKTLSDFVSPVQRSLCSSLNTSNRTTPHLTTRFGSKCKILSRRFELNKSSLSNSEQRRTMSETFKKCVLKKKKSN